MRVFLTPPLPVPTRPSAFNTQNPLNRRLRSQPPPFPCPASSLRNFYSILVFVILLLTINVPRTPPATCIPLLFFLPPSSLLLLSSLQLPRALTERSTDAPALPPLCHLSRPHAPHAHSQHNNHTSQPACYCPLLYPFIPPLGAPATPEPWAPLPLSALQRALRVSPALLLCISAKTRPGQPQRQAFYTPSPLFPLPSPSPLCRDRTDHGWESVVGNPCSIWGLKLRPPFLSFLQL